MSREQPRWLATGFAVGAIFAYLIDGGRGRQRRRVLRERSAGSIRHAARRCARASRTAVLRTRGRSRGLWHDLHPPRPEALDEAGLAHRVESVLFRDPNVPKGKISINAERGTVFLRGQVDSAELIDELTESVRRIAGVTDVVNLLHLPGTPAPHND